MREVFTVVLFTYLCIHLPTYLSTYLTYLGAQMVKRLPAMWETQGLNQKDLLEKEMVTNSSILAWKNPMDGRTW